MTYIFLVAGKGTRLHPLTLSYPKTLFKLNDDETVIQRMISLIKECDDNPEIVVVTGFMHKKIEDSLSNLGVKFVFNPFYAVTNSIASLWFAKEYLERDNITIINGDIVMSKKLVNDVLCKPVNEAKVLFDSSVKKNGDYNVHTNGEHVVVMSKDLDEYDGEYAGVSKLDNASAQKLLAEINMMMDDEQYTQWYENALVQMIFRENFKLGYIDIFAYQWTEVDTVKDMAFAKRINNESK